MLLYIISTVICTLKFEMFYHLANNKEEKPMTTISKAYSSVKNPRIEGRKLLVDRVTTTYNVTCTLNTKGKPSVISKRPIKEISTPLIFPLLEVKPEELEEYRRNGIPSFVLKMDEKFYYTQIPRDITFVGSNILGPHKCASVGKECMHLSPASDAEGGCAKVRNHSRCIERYPWIKKGYETFNTPTDVFVVACCEHYERCLPNKTVPLDELIRRRADLYRMYYDLY